MLAAHNLALVGCAAAPFYLRLMIRRREQCEAAGSHALDKLLARTINAALPYCLVFAVVLIATGIGMPLNRAINSGALRPMDPVAGISAILKLACVAAFAVTMGFTYLRVNRRLLRLLEEAATANRDEVLALSERRRKLLGLSTLLAAAILILSGFMRFQMC